VQVDEWQGDIRGRKEMVRKDCGSREGGRRWFKDTAADKASEGTISQYTHSTTSTARVQARAHAAK